MTHSLLVTLAPGAPALLGQEDSLNVGQHATLGDGHTGQQFVELFVVFTRVNISSDSEYKAKLEVAGDDVRLLVVQRCVVGELEDLGGKVLHHRGHVDWGAGADMLGVVVLPALKH
jgi:hypothetical protein